MIHHHAVSKAAAQEHVRDLIAQATAGRVAARPKPRWSRHVAEWVQRLVRTERQVHRDAHHKAIIPTANRPDTPTAGGVKRVQVHHYPGDFTGAVSTQQESHQLSGVDRELKGDRGTAHAELAAQSRTLG